MKKRIIGFTLVELLAVIVILAIILAIAIPNVTGIVNEARRNAFESNVKLLARAIDNKKAFDSTFDPTTVTKDNVDDLFSMPNDNYKTVSVAMATNGESDVTIVGDNKWNNLVASGTKENITVDDTDSYDTTAPTITILGDNPLTIAEGLSYTDAGATAADNIDGDVTSNITVTSDINTNIPGTYSVTYQVADAAGNIETAIRTVIVTDNLAPSIVFGTNGNATYTNSGSTTVTVTDAGGVDNSSLKYQWNTSSTAPTEEDFADTFTNGDTITSPAGVSGEYYLWILAKDTIGNDTIISSNVFYIDNIAPVIAVTGSNPISITVGSVYTDPGATAVDNRDGNITANIIITSTVNTNVAGTYTVTYNISDSANNAATPAVRTVIVQLAETANPPVLANGMTPIKWNGSSWVTTTAGDSGWYNYTNKQWANAKTNDGSLWVWIPRYIYKISSNWHTSTAGTIQVQFSNGTNDNWNSSTIGNINTDTSANASNNTWTNELAFTFGSTELTGFWIAKFEASYNVSYVQSKDNVASMRSQKITDVFTYCRSMETTSAYGWGTSGSGIDTHLTKNVEWGAVTYLGKSQYGLQDVGIWINPQMTGFTGCAENSADNPSTSACTYQYSTTNGVKTSTTGTVYGVYGFSGGPAEYVAAYLNNGNSNLSTYGSNLVNAATQYKDIYTKATTDNAANDYALAVNKKGDAMYETSSSGSSTTWYGDYSYMPYASYPFIIRGGYWNNGTAAGMFSFYYVSGNYNDSFYSWTSFRPVLLVGQGL